jgi:hypothetical protein
MRIQSWIASFRVWEGAEREAADCALGANMNDRKHDTFEEQSDGVLAEFELLRARVLSKGEQAVGAAKARLRLTEARRALAHSMLDWLESSNGFLGSVRAAWKRSSVLACARSVESAALALSEISKELRELEDVEAVKDGYADVAKCKSLLRG